MEGNLRLEAVAAAAGVSTADLRSIIATLRASGLTHARIEHFSTHDILWNTPPKGPDGRPITGKIEIEWRRRMDSLKPAVQAIHRQIILAAEGGGIDFDGPSA
jgi:hypothetical protein